MPGGSQKSKWKNLEEKSEKDNYFSFCLSLAMLLFLLEKTQGLLAHNQVGVGVVAVIVLHNQEVDTYEGQGLAEGEKIRRNSWRKHNEPAPSFPKLFWPCAGERHHQAPCGKDGRDNDDHD